MKPLQTSPRFFLAEEKKKNKNLQFAALSSITKANALTVDNGLGKYKQYFLGFGRLQPECAAATIRNNFPSLLMEIRKAFSIMSLIVFCLLSALSHLGILQLSLLNLD